ncbi:MAG TPA: transglutaminase domain-containing protein [Acidobacteriota bacterium]|nr:transglutaminase domain-containing protein [Acidobacteriota bacterium]
MSVGRTLGLAAVLSIAVSQWTIAAPGDTVKSVPSPFACPQGLTYDGSHLWCVDRRTDMIYRIDPADGAVTDSLPSPGYVPRGLTWDGRRLWCVDADEELIYAINPRTRIVEQTIDCPASRPGDLAWDGTYLWIVSDGDDKIHQISPEDGTTIVSLTAPTANPVGLTYDGTYLWVSDRIGDRIYGMTTDGGDVIYTFATPGPHTWGLAWDGRHLWNVDYQTDRIYQMTSTGDARYKRLTHKTEGVEFLHQVRNHGPDTVQTLDVYFAIPQERDNQEILSPPVFDPEPTAIIPDRWGQKVAHFHFEKIPPSQFATVRMQTSVRLHEIQYSVDPRTIGTVDQCPKEIRDMYLADDTKFGLTNEQIMKGVKEAVGDETNAYWIARKIFNYVIDHIEYELAGGWNIAPTVLARGTGSCSEYSFVYIAMCRAAGLPARYVGSIVVRGDDASYDDVFHRWVEVYLPNFGWLPVDPSGGDSPWPSGRANYFGHLRDRYLITTEGGGGSEYLEWGYNANARWTTKGRCKLVAENFAEWTPIETAAD